MLIFFAWMFMGNFDLFGATKLVSSAPPCPLQFRQMCPQTDDLAFRQCLSDKRLQLSPHCQGQVAPTVPVSMDELNYHCQKDAEKFCHRSPLDTFSCLQQQAKKKASGEATVSTACQQAIKRLKG